MSDICVGCGAEAPAHPIVVVTSEDRGPWEAKPVCMPCWENPEHRTTPIFGHFFARDDARYAVSVAGSSTLGG